MQSPKTPANEAERLRAMAEYEILDSGPEQSFDDVAKLAAFIAGTPVALVTFVDEGRQWFKARVGLPDELTQTSRAESFCGHLVFDGRPLVVGDASLDARFSENPLVKGSPGVRFYAGQPLTDHRGFTFGSLCVLDVVPRELSPPQTEALAALARQVMELLGARREAVRLRALTEQLDHQHRMMRNYFERDDQCLGVAELRGDLIVHIYNNSFTRSFLLEHGVGEREFRRGDPVPTIDRWFDAYAECARTRQPQVFDCEIDGRILCCGCAFLTMSDQGFPQMSFSMEDVTERRAIERQLSDQRQMMIQSAKLSALGEMAAGLAHEINNPLAIIGGRAQEVRMRIERGGPPEKLLPSVDSIDKTVTRISKIIKGLRSFSRDSSQDPLVPTRLADVIADTLAFCTARFSARGVEFRSGEVDPEVALQCRSAEISQVLLNLLNNAYDAVSEREGTRWIRMDVEIAPAGIEIAISDNGPGIPVELRDKIMQPFFTTKPVNRGTGLGLSISRALVEAHGGRLELDVTSPCTRFVVRLPRATQ